MTSPSTHPRAAIGTSAGVLSVVIWSMTAPIIGLAVGIDPFLYVALGDGIGALAFVAMWVVQRHNPLPELRTVPIWLYGLGFIGISVHNLTWVAALQQAPPLEATLIIYTWPLMVVIFTAISKGQPLRWYHLVAGALGLAGIAALLTGRGLDLDGLTLMPGHLWAVVSAVTWSVFSAVAARDAQRSSSYLGVVFLLSGLVSAMVWIFVLGAPPAPGQSLWIAGSAAAFFALAYGAWDFGMKHGNAQLIGVVSFLTPVLSAVYLVVLGQADLTIYLVVSLVLILTGIGIARYGDRLARA